VCSNDSRRRGRRGQSLVEFALVALVLTLILAATMDFGRATYSAQAIQQAADVTARELARTPLPATLPPGLTSLQPVLDNQQPPGVAAADWAKFDEVHTKIFDPNWLVFDLDKVPQGTTVPDYFAQNNAPLLNQLLLSLMVSDLMIVDANGTTTGGQTRLLRYPGQLTFTPNAANPSGYQVTSAKIALVTYDANGQETVQDPSTWFPVVEEIQVGTPAHSPFGIDAAEGGVLALRINFPFQAAALSDYPQNPAAPFDPNLSPNLVTQAPTGGNPGPYGGPDGLGQQLALGKTVRPYRKVLSAQAMHRRELFVP